jgi:methanogenic corrinoid protein MtbC1
MSAKIIENLKKAILDYDREGAASWAKKAVHEKVDPTIALNAVTVAIRQVGDGFSRKDLFLPDLVGAAEAMTAATPIIEEEINRVGGKKESLGAVAIGTIYGDMHTIGKTMVTAFLRAEGFVVYDLGVNVPAETFVEAVNKYKLDILAISALMTTTAPELRKVVSALKEKGIRDKVKVMVGGGAVTQNFSDSIGADGYDPTAPGGAKLARKLVKLV